MRVLIIADDLTGALDSAATLTGGGRRCLVARRPGDVAAALAARPDVLAVATASREGSAPAARAAVEAAFDAVAAGGWAPAILMKKVDSRLKGHVAAEVAALAGRAGLSRALLAPAIPAQGRRVAGGEMTGPGLAAPLDVAGALAPAGLAAEVPDTAGEADFDAPLARALDEGATLLVGAAGLAAAIARRLGGEAAPRPRLSPPLLLAVGSHDPITLAQVARLSERGVPVLAAPGGACPAPPEGAAALIRLTAAAGRPFDAAADPARFAEGIAALARAGRPGTLLGCGGETADAILGALGVGVLALEGEILPGVPVSRILVGGRPLGLVTKSGGFGTRDALVSVVEAAGGEDEA